MSRTRAARTSSRRLWHHRLPARPCPCEVYRVRQDCVVQVDVKHVNAHPAGITCKCSTQVCTPHSFKRRTSSTLPQLLSRLLAHTHSTHTDLARSRTHYPLAHLSCTVL